MASNFTLFSMFWITFSIYRRIFSCKFLPYQKKNLAEESNTSKRYSFVCEIERVITLSCAISSLWWIISLDKGLNQLLYTYIFDNIIESYPNSTWGFMYYKIFLGEDAVYYKLLLQEIIFKSIFLQDLNLRISCLKLLTQLQWFSLIRSQNSQWFSLKPTIETKKELEFIK